MTDEQQQREMSLELLRSNHVFPGPFVFRTVVQPGSRDAVVAALVAAAGGDEHLVQVTQRSSRAGRFLAVRVTVTVERAEMVLHIFELLKTVDGVITAL